MSGMTVLVVEDDFIVAYDMQMMLEEQGARVLGPATSLAEAQELLTAPRLSALFGVPVEVTADGGVYHAR